MLITTSIFVMKEYFNTLQKEMEGKKKTNVKLENKKSKSKRNNQWHLRL